MYVCLCFGVTEKEVHAQIAAGACSPRQIASACRAGTDCGGCVKRIQALLGRPAAGSHRTAAPVAPAARQVPWSTRPVPVRAARADQAAVEAADGGGAAVEAA